MLHPSSSSLNGQTFSFEEAHQKVTQIIAGVTGKILSVSHSITATNSYAIGEGGKKIQQYYVSLIIITE